MELDKNDMTVDNTQLKYFSAPDAKVLLVDDQEINIIIYSGIMEFYDIIPDIAENGLEAIQKVKNNKYDIIFMDHLMPEMNGIEATVHIRNMGNDYSFDNLSIIALTADTETEIKELLLKSGMNDYMSKPVDKDLICNALKKWLPKDKQLVKDNIETEELENNYSQIIEGAKNINGLDTELGLKHIRTIADYEFSLKLLNRKIPKICKELVDYLANNDMKRFMIDVHGVKGILATNGHMELAEIALTLEKEAKNDNITFCRDNISSFLVKLKSLGDSLNKLFVQEDIKVKKQGSQRLFVEAINELNNYVRFYNRKKALEVMEHILNYTFSKEADKLIIQINEALEEFEFELAEELLNNLSIQEV